MAVINAIKTGNWLDATVWAGGIIPAANDEVHANGFTVTITSNISAAEITTAAKNGGGAGGSFLVGANNITITANITAGSTICLLVGYYTDITINGNVNGSHANVIDWAYAITASGDKLTVNGIVKGGGQRAFQIALSCDGLKNLMINGDVIGGDAWRCSGIKANSPVTIAISGNIVGGINTYVPAIESENTLVTISKLTGLVMMQPSGSYPLGGCIVFSSDIDITMMINTEQGSVAFAKADECGIKFGTDSIIIN